MYVCVRGERERETGGHSGTEGGRTRITYFAEGGVFLRPPHVHDFVREGYFLYPGTK